MSVSRDIKDFTKLIFFSLLTCLIKYIKIKSGIWEIINNKQVVTKLKKKRRMRIISTRIFLSFLAGKNKNFWTALNTSFFFERQKIVLEKVQLNRVIIFPYIFLQTCRVLERNIPILFCSSVKSCLSLLFDSRLKHQRYSPFILQEIDK